MRPRAGAADAAPRAARPTPSGCTYAFRRCVARDADRDGIGRAAGLAANSSERVSPTAAEPWELAAGRSGASRRRCPPASTPAQARRLDRRRPRAAEPGRDDHQGMSRVDAMNCQDHLYRGSDPTQRRPPLVPQGVRRRPRRHRARPSCSARQRCAAAATGRPIRSRRSSRTSRRRPSTSSSCSWPARPSHLELFDNKPQLAKFDGTLPPPELLEGLPRRVHQSELEAARPEVQVRQARPVRRRAVRAAAAPGDGRRRHRHRQVDGDRRVQPRARPDPDEHRLAAVRPAEPGRLGHSTAWAASRRTCPASSSSAPARRAPAAATRNWGSGFLPTVYQGVQFRSSGDPVLYLSNPRGRRRRRCSATRSTPINAAQPACGSTRSATRRSPRASTPSRWPSACSPARRS